MNTTFEQLIVDGIIKLEDSDSNMERDEYVSYVVSSEYTILLENQAYDTLERVTYIQLIATEDNDTPHIWVVQLEGHPENPNNHIPNKPVEMSIFKLME